MIHPLHRRNEETSVRLLLIKRIKNTKAIYSLTRIMYDIPIEKIRMNTIVTLLDVFLASCIRETVRRDS